MKKAIMLIIAFALSVSAEVSGNHLPRKGDVVMFLRGAAWSTVDSYQNVTPVIIGGKRSCVYAGSVMTATDEYGNCSDMNFHHLQRVVRTDGKLTCFYDRTRDGDYYFWIDKKDECYDILVSKNGFNFQMGIYFDSVDTPDLYFIDPYKKSLLGSTLFEGNLRDFGRVQKQILFRKRYHGAQEEHSVKMW